MTKVSMVSLTFANKSKSIFAKLGYTSNVLHNVKPSGCEYVLIVDAPKTLVLTTLKKEGIPIKEFL
ncbi:MAG: hypothetical protein LIO71_10405 [Ruminococcus sp.]|nr:hypothetical protein [Ruminococcus sp.]MCD7799957.1 hypothetical protein [Ruminococcus sp.]